MCNNDKAVSHLPLFHEQCGAFGIWGVFWFVRVFFAIIESIRKHQRKIHFL